MCLSLNVQSCGMSFSLFCDVLLLKRVARVRNYFLFLNV